MEILVLIPFAISAVYFCLGFSDKNDARRDDEIVQSLRRRCVNFEADLRRLQNEWRK
jgi:hypothetical protein